MWEGVTLKVDHHACWVYGELKQNGQSKGHGQACCKKGTTQAKRQAV